MLKNDGHHSSQVTIRVTTIEKGRILDAARTEMTRSIRRKRSVVQQRSSDSRAKTPPIWKRVAHGIGARRDKALPLYWLAFITSGSRLRPPLLLYVLSPHHHHHHHQQQQQSDSCSVNERDISVFLFQDRRLFPQKVTVPGPVVLCPQFRPLHTQQVQHLAAGEKNQKQNQN